MDLLLAFWLSGIFGAFNKLVKQDVILILKLELNGHACIDNLKLFYTINE